MELRIRKTIEKDVAVIGGGTAGCFAAIAAAASGATTILIEKNGVLGGTVTAGGVNYPGLFHAWGKQIIDGPCWEAIKRTESLGGTKIPDIVYKPDKHWRLQVRMNSFIYQSVLDAMCKENDVEVWLHTILADAKETSDGVMLVVAGKEGLICINAKKVIDASGDANLTELLGYSCEKSANLQPATLAAELGGYDKEKITEEVILPLAQKGVDEGRLPEWITARKVFGFLRSGHFNNMHTACPQDADTSYGKSGLEQTVRREMLAVLEFMRTLPECENIYIKKACGEAGVRETNRIVGEYKVTAEDYISGKRFEDAVCYAFYPIDLHEPFGIKQIFLEDGVVPTVPYRAMIPKGAKHLLAVGRILSSDTDANSALRVQATCMAEGQAAGVAAAIASKQDRDVVSVDYEELCQGLCRLGAIVPGVKNRREE